MHSAFLSSGVVSASLGRGGALLLLLSVCMCVCVCVFCGLWITYSSRVLLAAGALREDRSALYPYMACHGASPYLRRSTH